MKNIMVLYSLIFFTTSIKSQNLDSLENLLKTYTKKDTVRAKILLDIVRVNLYKMSEENLNIKLNEVILISKNKDWFLGEILSYQRLGAFYSAVKNDYSKALEFYIKCLYLNQKISNKKVEQNVIGNIGLIYFETRQYNTALKYLDSCLIIAKDNHIKDDELLNQYLTIGNIHTKLKNFDIAYYYYKKVLDISYEKKLTLPLANVTCILGGFYIDKVNYDSSIYFIKKSIELSRDLAIPMLNIVNFSNFALSLCKIKKNDEALIYADTAMDLARKIEGITWKAEILKTKAEIYQNKGDFENAFNSYVDYKELNDSIASDEKKQEYTKSLSKFEFEKKEAVLTAENKAKIIQQKYILYTIGGGALVLGLGSILFFRQYKRKRNAQIKQAETEFISEISDTEMKALRAQMNPHFIFNSLNSIGDYIAKNNTKLADEYLAKFAKLMRLILENSEKKEVPLADDLKALELYMQLEALRMNQKFAYQIKVDTDIDMENTLVPPLLLQPFVENSIWHGISNKEGVGNILVHIKKEGEMINCVVQDDGIGRKLAAEKSIITESKKSLGMKITKARIDILNKVKNATAAVQLFDLAQGTRVEVKLPLTLSF
jgi:tetratricopeptide (TPR) repeat protein